jgi:hypothetical protein
MSCAAMPYTGRARAARRPVTLEIVTHREPFP